MKGIQLSRCDFEKATQTRTSLIVGPTGCGKTSLVNEILQAHAGYDIYRENPLHTEQQLRDFFRSKQFDAGLTWAIYDNRAVSRNAENYNVIINGRHRKIYAIVEINCSFPTLPPEFRVNFDNVFLFGSSSRAIIRKYHSHYGSMLDYETFGKYMRYAKSYGGWLVINQSGKGKGEGVPLPPADITFHPGHADRAARTIQRWWLEIWLSPTHPVGRRRLEREYDRYLSDCTAMQGAGN